ncbi:MAG: DnaT-like ssDNA-binding protein [Verrucomicrobiota bacterium]
MALILIKESGTGLPDANAYADAADGDAYFDGHLYAMAWTAASAGNKDAALVFATRLIDAEYQFYGFTTKAAQALSLPRQRCPDPDGESGEIGFLPSDAIPKEVLQATCEMARELLILDRTAAPLGEGLKYQNVGSDQTGYSKTDVRPIISHVAQALLAKFGTLIKSKSGSVSLVRV